MGNFFEIKVMTLEEVGQVADLEEKIFSHAWGKKSLDLAVSSQQNLCLTVKDSEREVVAGYCIFSISFEDADLCRIAVADEYRRRHLADKMFESAFEKLKKRNVERILLEVRENNSAAIALYIKYGFEQIGKRKNYYSEPVEDGLIFECRQLSGF